MRSARIHSRANRDQKSFAARRDKARRFLSGGRTDALPSLDRRPTFEPLEVRSLLAIDISDFQLIVDNGSSSSDAITSDPRVSGVVGGTFDSPQATHAGIQFDHDGDGLVDGAVTSTTIAATFTYDPQPSGLTSGQAVNLRYRAVEKDAAGAVVETGDWTSFSFSFAESSRGAIDVRQDTTAVLHNETSLTFGPAPLGSPVTKTFTIRNTGASPLNLTSRMLVPEGFTLQTPISVSSLAPWQETTFALRLDATAEGSYTGDVYFFNGDVDENPFHFTLSGSVVASEAKVELGAVELISGVSSVDFGQTPTGTAIEKTFTVTNVGDHNLILGEPIAVPSGFTVTSSFGSTTLAPDQSTTFTVRLTAAASGLFSGNLSFATNDPDANPFVIAVAGRVGQPEIAVSVGGLPLTDGQSTIQFGHTAVCAAIERTLTIQNVGQGTLVLDEPVSLPAGFSVVSSFGDTTLAPNESTTLVVQMYATAAGEYSGALVIGSNDLDNASFDVTVIGEVSRPDITVSVGGTEIASGGAISFGTSAAGEEIQRTIVVTNVGANSLLLSALPTMPSGFSLVSGYGTTTLAPNDSTSFVVQYNAAAAGAITGELSLGSNDPNEAQYVLTLAGSALALSNLGLLNDTGSSQTDDFSSDPRIIGAVTGPHAGADFEVEVDLDADSNPDETINPAASGAFVYLAPDLELGEVELGFRVRVWSDVLDDYVAGAWVPVTFTFESGTDAAPTVTDLGLRVNTGNPTDTITSNPMLVGAIDNDGRVDGYTVEIDLDNDDEPDAETTTDVLGEFGYFPTGLALGTHTVQARVLETRYDDTTVEGDWTPFTFTLVAPAAPVVTEFDLKRDTGSSDTDGVTFDSTLMGTVVTEGNWQLTTVEFDYNNDNVVDGTAGLNADGEFEHAPSQLSPGSYPMRARAVDRLNDLTGNWTSVMNVTLQQIPAPTIETLELANDTGESSTDEITSDPTLQGTIDSEINVSNQLIEVDLDGDLLVDATTYTDQEGAFIYDPGWLGQGDHTVRARATVNVAGATVSSSWVSLTFELVPPSPPAVESLALANDTGESSTDLVTWDPTVVGTLESDGNPLPFRRVEFDENGDGQVDGQAFTDEAGGFSYRAVGLEPGEVTIAARGVDYDPRVSDFVTGPWEQLSFELEEYEGLATPPSPDAVDTRDDAATAAGDGADSNAAAVLPAIGEFNAAVGSSLPGSTGIYLGIGHYVFLWDLHDGSVPQFGAFGYQSGLPTAGGPFGPIYIATAAGVPAAADYGDTIIVSETVNGAAIDGVLDYTYVVEVFPATQTFTIDVVVDYLFDYDKLGSPEIHISGGYHFEFHAAGAYSGTSPNFTVSGTYNASEDGWYTGSWTDDYSFTVNSADEDTTVTGDLSTSLAYDFVHAVPTATFYSSPTTSSVSASFWRTEDAGYIHARNETVDYSLHFFGDEKTGLSHSNNSTSHSYSLSENGSYDSGTGIRDVNAFVFTETGGFATHFDDSADFTLQYSPGELTGDYNVEDSLSYSYSRSEAGNYEVGSNWFSINGTNFTRNESAGETHDVSGSASFAANVTGYQEDAELSISRTAAGDFSYTATGDYTVTNTSLSINGDSFERLISGGTWMTLSASGSFSRSDAFGQSHGPYSVSQAITATADQEDHGSFSINNIGLYSEGTADETGALDASLTESQSSSYSKSFGGSMSHGTAESSNSATYTIDYDDTITYEYGPTSFSATGSFHYQRESTADSEGSASKSFSNSATGSNSNGTVEGEISGSTSESYSESGDYSMAGGATSRSVNYTLDELSYSDSNSTHSRTYAEGIYSTTSVSGSVTTTTTVTAEAGTVVSKPSGSSSFTAHETGSYSEGPSTVSMSVNFSADGSRVEQTSATGTMSIDHTASSYSPGMVTEGFHSKLDSDSESISSHSQTFEKAYHVPTGGLTRTASGQFLFDEVSNTTATLDSSRTYTYGGSMAIMLTGSYSSESASIKGTATGHSDSTVSSSLSETGTFSMSGPEPGMASESRTTTAIERALTTGNETYHDSGTYLDGFGGSFDTSNSRKFSLTSSESAIFATGGLAGSPYISTNSQSGSFSTSESAHTVTNSTNVRGFIEPSEAGSYTTGMTSSATSTAVETGTFTQHGSINLRTVSFTLDESISANTTSTETGDYGEFCAESVSLGFGAGCATMSGSAPSVPDPSSGGGKSGTYTDAVDAYSLKSVHEQGTRTIDHGVETRVATFTIDEDVNEFPSFTTSYSYSEFQKFGGEEGKFNSKSTGWKTASLIESGNYTETPSGISKWTSQTKSESLIFTTNFTDIGTSSLVQSSETFSETSNVSFTFKETGLGAESYSDVGTYSHAPNFSDSAGDFERDEWNVKFGNNSSTQTYTRTVSDTTTSGSVTESNNTLRIYLYDEGGTYSTGSAGSSEIGDFSEYLLTGGNTGANGSGQVNYGGSRTSTFTETKGGKDLYTYGIDGSFERLPCGHFQSFGYGVHESNTGSSTYIETGSGSAFMSGSGLRSRGDGAYFWSQASLLPWWAYGDMSPESFTFKESGSRQLTYSEEGDAETLGTTTTSANGTYSESSWEDNKRQETVSASHGSATTITNGDVTDTKSWLNLGNESASRSMFSAFTADGSIVIEPGDNPGFGSGCASGSSSGPPPEPPVGYRTGEFDSTITHQESLNRYESRSGSASHTEPDGNGVLTAQGSESWIVNTTQNVHEWGSYSNPYDGYGSGEGFSSSSGFEGKDVQHTEFESASGVHTMSASGTGNGSGNANGSCSGGCGGSALGHSWQDSSSESDVHTFSLSGHEVFGTFAPTPANTGTYSEYHSQTRHSRYDDEGSADGTGWNIDRQNDYSSWYRDAGSYDYGVSTGAETAFQEGVATDITYFSNGTTSGPGTFESPENGGETEVCEYPQDPEEEECSADGLSEPIDWETILDWVQTALDIIGFIPGPIGMIADVLNTGISLARGDWEGAALNAIGIIPGLGDAAKAAKMGANALQGASKLADAAKTAGKLADAGKGAGKSGLGAGRAASNFAGQAGDAAATARGANRAADGISTGAKVDAPNCGSACKVGGECFVGDTPVVLGASMRGLPESDEQLHASLEDAGASNSDVAGVAVAVGVAGIGLALIADRRRRRDIRAADVDSLLATTQHHEWCGRRGDQSAAQATDEFADQAGWPAGLCDQIFGEYGITADHEARPDELADSSAGHSQEIDSPSPGPDASPGIPGGAELVSTRINLPSGSPERRTLLPAARIARWSGIALAIAGFALFGWLRWQSESGSFDFARGTSLTAASEPTFLTKPIRDIEVISDRVLSHRPAADPATSTLGAVDPATWRVVHLQADKLDGDSIEIALARPLSWLEQHRAETGATIALDLPEFGVSGRARVTLIAPCPAVPDGNGELVTGKFIHYSGELLDLYVEGNDEPLGVTLNHLFWSEDRQQFVPARDLQPGEHLLSAGGDELPILHVERRVASEPVYNLEVDGQHVYFVSRAGLLVHNACGPGKWIDDNYGTRPSRSYQAQVTGKPKKQYQVGKVKFDGYKGGKLVEAKGVGYKNLLNGSKKGKEVAKEVKQKLLKQARRQVAEAAKHGKPVKWVFAEKEAAEMMRKSLEKMGIEVTVKKMDWGKMID